MTRLKEPLQAHCGSCVQPFVRWCNRGSMSVCTPCQRKARVKAWKVANPERKRALNQKWAEENREKDRAVKAEWTKRNSGYAAAKTKRYLTRKASAYAGWANDFFIDEAYRLAQLRTQMFGFPWQVDHIVPLQGKTVCGLHVENNLQVIPAMTNRAKSNKFTCEGNP